MNSVAMLMEKIVTMVFLFGLRTEVGWSKKKKVVMMVGIWSEVGQSVTKFIWTVFKSLRIVCVEP